MLICLQFKIIREARVFFIVFFFVVIFLLKVQIFDKNTNEVKRTSTRSKDNLFGARFRDDGRLMVTGGESGLIQVS